ncbi:MAG: hypothetical protein IJT94_04510 [Oscillibacter sp.]|nr:hypothetical protein [Oscillibacter sp.]
MEKGRAARLWEAVKTLPETAEQVLQTLWAAGVRPVTARLEVRENTLWARAEIRAGELTFCLNAAWGQETFFRLEAERPELAP